MSEPKFCILCGKPRPAGAYKFCEACRKKMKAERDKRGRLKQALAEREEAKADIKTCILCGAPRPKGATKYCEECRIKKEKEWNKKKRRKPREKQQKPKSEVVNCKGCFYWRNMYVGANACHYPIETNQLRPMPAADCYKHDGTPYRPKK